MKDILEGNDWSLVSKSDAQGLFPEWHVFSRIDDGSRRNREFRVSQEWLRELRLESDL